ncbi:hypothetical protein HBI26_048430 [Parastagonospora nodorum]|nr:hypothetical protein HBH50_076800 [Parastagonospora nodorum]KAH4093823.1 hypothetical protein HBH48_065050 [Parastagonospora nodorum]KAH5081450.1 hypothetical protein HBH95_065040 [Parastagonospora nodorum]KAH5378498.1 hypothetical protein HBI49_024170 [Parastagonospora nodorum]KAH5605815.1 hypothetical protein HBI26_048430 [Parastagonospora nodorum]
MLKLSSLVFGVDRERGLGVRRAIALVECRCPYKAVEYHRFFCHLFLSLSCVDCSIIRAPCNIFVAFVRCYDRCVMCMSAPDDWSEIMVVHFCSTA